eukprot:g2458.t1
MAQYGKYQYWDERYTKDPEPFDWYQRYSGVKEIIADNVQKSANILNIGCGNSRLSEDMYEDGYQSIANIDISEVVIAQMQAKYKEKYASMSFQKMNAMELKFPDQSFNVVLDKGTLDSVLCGEGSTSNVAKMLNEVARVMTDDGVYVCISYGTTKNRLSYLETDELKDVWDVSVKQVAKPSVSTATQASEDSGNVHYIYICKKKGGDS